MSQPDSRDLLFLSLIFNLQAAAMQQLGKMVSPLSGKVERDLAAAKQSIDLLESLERKTRGNLSADEARAMQDILTTLRLNYVDELKRGETPDETPAPPAQNDEAAGGATS